MKIVFNISYEELADGTFKPVIEITEESSNKEITGFIIEGTYSSKEEALKIAKTHAESEVLKRYGDDMEVAFTVND